MKTNLKAVVYARFSSDMQREESIEAQIRAIREYAQRNGMDVIAEYVDRAKSATTDQRPEFLRMIDDSKSKSFSVVLVHKLDRFARNRYDSMGYRNKLKRNGVKLISALETYDPDSPEGILLESVLEGMNEFYSKNLAREVEKGKRENALKCMHVGGIPPLGYNVDPQTRKLVINEYEAQAVKIIFGMFLDGKTYDEIIRQLNARGFKTKWGQPFGYNSLYSLLHNEKYIGIYTYSRSAPKDMDGKRNGHKYKPDDQIIRVEGGVPAIIAKEDFSRVLERMKSRTHVRSRPNAKQAYLLSGVIVCGHCGKRYSGNSRKAIPGHRQYVSYRCNSGIKNPDCPNREIRREVLEGYVLSELADFIFDESYIPSVIKGYRDFLNAQNKDVLDLMDALKRQIHEIGQEMENIMDVISKTASDALVGRLNSLSEQKKQLENKLLQTRAENKTPDISEENIIANFHRARELLRSGELVCVRTLIHRFIKQVTVFQDTIELRFNLPITARVRKLSAPPLMNDSKHAPKNKKIAPQPSSTEPFAMPFQSSRMDCESLLGGEGGI